MSLIQFYEAIEKRIRKAIDENLISDFRVLENMIEIGNDFKVEYQLSYPSHCDEKEMCTKLIINYKSENVLIKEVYFHSCSGFRFIYYTALNLDEAKKTFEMAKDNKKLKKLLEKQPIRYLNEDLEKLMVDESKLKVGECKPIAMLKKEYITYDEIENAIKFFPEIFLIKLKQKKLS